MKKSVLLGVLVVGVGVGLQAIQVVTARKSHLMPVSSLKPKEYVCIKGLYDQYEMNEQLWEQVEKDEAILAIYQSKYIEHGRDAARNCMSEHGQLFAPGDWITIVRTSDEFGKRNDKISYLAVLKGDKSLKAVGLLDVVHPDGSVKKFWQK